MTNRLDRSEARNDDTGNPGLSGSRLFFALLAGFALFVAFPKFGLGFLSWIALVPLFVALRGMASIGRSFLLGWIAGFLAHIGLLYWIAYVAVHYGNLSYITGSAVMLLLAAYLSLYTGFFAAGIVCFRGRIPLWLSAPVLWVCLEYLKSYLFSGFPWANLGYSQYQNLAFIQMADLTGVYGISFLIVLLNVALYGIIRKRSKSAYALAGCVMLLWAAAYTYGFVRIQQIESFVHEGRPVEVSLIQGNIDQSVKWNPSFQEETLKIYETLSLQAKHSGGLIVWPETAVPFLFSGQGDYSRRVRAVAQKTGNHLLFGAMSYADQKGETDFYNSAYLLSPTGEVSGKYDKVHLVPYGEYVPLRDVFPFVRALTAGIGDFARGEGYKPLAMNGEKIGVLICYEAILPHAARTYKTQGAGLLVNITNDAWFGTTSAPYQHLSMAIFRSVETRLFLVRAANTGISCVVDPKGRIVANTDIFKQDRISAQARFLSISTVYARFGDWFPAGCFALIAGMILWTIKGRWRDASRKHSGNRQ
ncbi:MAG TPA: apolipoprotein N-acyltransferase [Smithellaceae bacterium]|nr:apolipoprotein N-acyltransferase [Smithellaceae bacterium]